MLSRGGFVVPYSGIPSPLPCRSAQRRIFHTASPLPACRTALAGLFYDTIHTINAWDFSPRRTSQTLTQRVKCQEKIGLDF